ncbi:EAL domain-containing protein [Pontibacterium granulatum]|uniref:bifunctional diguanylate cyclase/phosphodiesterase n=1 Tax=Pontibacterium granulatum TaxID=2036029 RepID=UPI002499DCA8|nr:EAL domain-containing protein [Pontibacterium granulatum]MDI3324187.1 EAL domain-containing protein [Pontibacterium granulatum]
MDYSNLVVPQEVVENWQRTVDLIAELAHIPAALIMRVHECQIEVFARSSNQDNPYNPQERANLGTGLYCETVINSQSPLLVPNALNDPQWDHNPDLPLGMISYFGLPLSWPNGSPFGTICMLDRQENSYTEQSRELVCRFQRAIEGDLQIIYQKHRLQQANAQLEARIKERTVQLEALNEELRKEIVRKDAVTRTLEYVTQYDALTGLPNQHSLASQLDNLLKEEGGSNTTVVSLGLKNFKSINHSYSYYVGDQLLVELSQRLTRLLPPDVLLARGNGDEFIVVVRHRSEASDAVEIISRITQTTSEAFSVTPYTITLALNMGIATAQAGGEDAMSLIQKASAAMGAAKETGNLYAFFDPKTESSISERSALETHLIDALANNEISVHYQPLMCPKMHKLLGVEALVRWNNPVLGNVRPDRFINLAEQNGIIHELGAFVMRSAIKQAAEWNRMLDEPIRVAINMSPVQFRDIHLAEQINSYLQQYGLAPELLELEITEGVLLQESYQTEQTLETLRKQGVRFSLDDFGTGYSSLSYLQKYPFDTLKIDRSFIADLAENKQSRELARTIIAISRKLNLHVIAEGVETEAQHQFLLEEGCDCGQGYLYGRPMAADTFQSQCLNLDTTESTG